MFNETKSHSSLSPESIILAAHDILISAVLFLLVPSDRITLTPTNYL